MSDDYPGIRLGTWTETFFRPYVKISDGYSAPFAKAFLMEENARDWIAPEAGDVIVRETITTVREVIRPVAGLTPADVEREKASEWADDMRAETEGATDE